MNSMVKSVKENFTSTRNACALCAPLGASIAFRGIENCIPVVHGSQGCSTYIRRYVISHFREPVDIASSNFSEESAIFGGGENLKTALDNVIRQYRPGVVGIASTCLSETIGDDVPLAVREFIKEGRACGTPVVHVSTPSYSGTHTEGYRAAVRAAVDRLSLEKESNGTINFLPPMVSTEDLRHLRRIAEDFGIRAVILPDYSESLDGASWDGCEKLPGGGTPVDSITGMAGAAATVEIGFNIPEKLSAGHLLAERSGVPLVRSGLPLGIDACDSFFKMISVLSGHDVPQRYIKERGRLVDAYIDAHKYMAGKKAVVFGDPDLCAAMALFLSETGIKTILCATGSRSMSSSSGGGMIIPGTECIMNGDTDFAEMLEYCTGNRPDIIIGSSKGYYLSRRLGVPLVRAGFPVHDRFGGQRLMHMGYRGTQQLFDRIVNALIEYKQESTETGYSYI